MPRACSSYKCPHPVPDGARYANGEPADKCTNCRRRKGRWAEKRPAERIERRHQLLLWESTLAEVIDDKGDAQRIREKRAAVRNKSRGGVSRAALH